ncbi:MAG: outer membrane beta-barrel protein [Planctomycetota bacterium]
MSKWVWIGAALLLATAVTGCATGSGVVASPTMQGYQSPYADEFGPIPQEQSGHRTTGNVDLLIGGRTLDAESDWDPVEEHGVFGVGVDIRGPGWLIDLEGGVVGSGATEDVLGIDVEARVAEVYLGVRKAIEFDTIPIVVYGGVGPTLISAEFDAAIGGLGVSDDDSSLAGYVHAGIYWRILQRVNLGLDFRGVFGSDLELFGVDTDADYSQVAFLLGFHW